MHIFDSTTIYELKSGDHDSIWDSVYSGISQSTLHYGAYGTLHDNTRVDTRPYEAESEDPELEEARDKDTSNPHAGTKYDIEAITLREDLLGFICCSFTSASFEASRVKSIVQGVIYILQSSKCIRRTKVILDILLDKDGDRSLREALRRE